MQVDADRRRKEYQPKTSFQQWLKPRLQENAEQDRLPDTYKSLFDILYRRHLDVSENYIYRIVRGDPDKFPNAKRPGYELTFAIGEVMGDVAGALEAAGYSTLGPRSCEAEEGVNIAADYKREHYNSFGALLKRVREDKCETQQSLADKVDLTHVAIGDWERGRRKPKRDNIKTIAAALGVTPDNLLMAAGYLPDNGLLEITMLSAEESQMILCYRSLSSDRDKGFVRDLLEKLQHLESSR